MKVINVTIERSEDAFYAYVPDLPGCTAGGRNYNEVKSNMEQILEMYIAEDDELRKRYAKGFRLKFEVDLESVFDLLPEINVSQLAKLGGLNAGLLRQYVSGTKKASEKQAQKVMEAIDQLINKLNSITLSS